MTRPTLFAFWSRIARSWPCCSACWSPCRSCSARCAPPAAARAPRSGLLIGIGFFLLQNMLESGAVVFDLDPVVLAWVPTGLLAMAALTLIARTR
jgi:hypothetical protein